MKRFFTLVAAAVCTVSLAAQEKIEPKIEAKPAPKIEVKDGLPRIPPAGIPEDDSLPPVPDPRNAEPGKTVFPPVPIPEAGTVLRGRIVIEILDPTDGGVFTCAPDMVEAVKAHIAAKQRGHVNGASTPIVATCTGPNCAAPIIYPQPSSRGVSGRFFPLSVPASGCASGRCGSR